MKKTLILGPVYTEVLNNIIGDIKANEDLRFDNEERVVSGGGYQAALLFSKFSFPYFWGVSIGSGEYGEEARKKAEEMGVEFTTTDNTSGCRYTIVSNDKHTTSFSVGGSENVFDLDAIELLPWEEYSGTIIFSEMLLNEDALIILAVLASVQKPIYLVIDERIMECDPDVLGALFELNPVVFIDEREANLLYAGEVMEVDRILDDMFHDAENDIYLLNHNDGIYFFDGKERSLLPIEEGIDIARLATGYVLAKNSNIDKRNSLLFAKEIGELSLKDIEGDLSDKKERLVRMISYK